MTVLVASPRINGDGSLNPHTTAEEVALAVIESPVANIPPGDIWRLNQSQVPAIHYSGSMYIPSSLRSRYRGLVLGALLQPSP